MKEKVKKAFWDEISKGKTLYLNKDFNEAFKHFERSHILGQSNPILHTYSHIFMLKIGIAKKDLKEIVGQLFRLPTGFLGSFIGIYPQGNTGGSNINPFKEMKIPNDLAKILGEKNNT